MKAQMTRSAPTRQSTTSVSAKKPKPTKPAAAATASLLRSSPSSAQAAASTSNATATAARVQVSPAVAEFINYDVDTSYVMPIEVRNRSEEILTFRFVAPARHATIFRLLNPASVRIAPGLAHTLEVEFSTHHAEDYADVLAVLSSDGGRVEVPLSACRVPQLEFAPLLDFGKVEQQHGTQARALTLVNRGRKDALVTFAVAAPTGKHAALSPQRGISLSSTTTVAAAQSRTSVTVELNTLPPGLYRWHVTVDVEGRRLPAGLDVVAEVLDCRSRLIDSQTNEEVVSLEFPETFAGNQKVHQLEVVNGGSQAISFAIQAAHTTSEDGAAPFRFQPSEGRLPPQGRQRVTALFCPPLQQRRTGWSSTTAKAVAATTVGVGAASSANTSASANATAASGGGAGSLSDSAAEERRYEALFSLLFVETEQTQSFRLVGTSCETVVFLSTSSMDFGTCLLKGSKQSRFTITNAVGHLPMRYELKPPSHFSVRPSRGVVQPGGSAEVSVEYHPSRLGPYEEPLTLTANNTVTRVITLRGNSVHRLPNRNSGSNNNGNHGSNSVEDATSARTLHHRVRDATLEAAVPAAVDLGMIPAEGLVPPALPRQVPAGVLRAEDTVPRAQQSSHVAPPVFGARSLVKRRFHTTPSTAHERQDCKRELTPMEVLNVVLPLKVLDFGRVTIHADVAASLFVFNGTKAAILAAVPTDADGLVSVDPPSQVVPPQRMAQFDVHLCSHTVQTFQQVMRVAVNQQHFMRFNIQAEVVPVEVTLSQREVRMALMGQAEEPVCTAQVTMGNSGNCAAAYRWHLPPGSEFDVEARTGVLEPGEQRSTVFQFCPAVGTTQATCEARLEVDGAVEDKVLSLIGTVAPAKCVWGPSAQMAVQDASTAAAAAATAAPSASNSLTKSKPTAAKDAAGMAGVLSLGRIAAGVPTIGTLTLANKGKTNAYFAIGSLPPWMTVTPAQGRVCTGETEELTVCVRQPTAGAAAHSVECLVVGMRKPLTVLVKATVVAPPLIVMCGDKEQSEVLLRFGEVYVGCPQSRSVVLRNTMDVAAAVSVNLEACTAYALASATLTLESGEVVGSGAELTASEAEARRSRVPSRLPSLRSASAAESIAAAAASVSAAVAPSATTGRPHASIIVVPPNADYSLRLAYNPTRPSEASRCAVRWQQIGADDLHPLPPFMLEAAAQRPPVVLSETSLSFAAVVVGQRPPPRVLYVRRNSPFSSGGSGEADEARSSSTTAPTPRAPHPPIPWRLQLAEDDGQGSLLIEPSRGVLAAGESEQAVTLTFLSTYSGDLHTQLQLKVGDDDGRAAKGEVVAPCGVCDVTAAAIDPRVRSSTNALMFPAVPLGVAVRATVLLFNEGYDSVHVDYAGASAPPLEVSFPDGHVMTSHAPRDQLPVTLTFCSPVPITVRSSIRLTTNAGGFVDLSVCGSAVNSILTTEAFVSYVSAAPAITAAADQPYTWAEADMMDDSDDAVAAAEVDGAAPQPPRAPRILCTMPMLESAATFTHSSSNNNSNTTTNTPERNPHELVDCVEAEVDWEGEKTWLAAWWSVYLCRTPVQDIIEAAQLSRGGLVADMIEYFTGKRPRRSDVEGTSASGPGAAAISGGVTAQARRKTTAAARAADAAQSLATTVTDVALPGGGGPASTPKELRSLDTLICHLRNCGACLSDIELPYLLPFDAYLEFMTDYHREVIEREVQQLEAGVVESALGAAFQRRSTASWLTVMREALRLFYVSQVRGVAILAPADLKERWAAAPFKRTLARSNIYSEEESVLLRWVEAAVETFRQAADPTHLRDVLSVTAPRQLEDMRDARRLLAVVATYVPACAAQIREGLLNATMSAPTNASPSSAGAAPSAAAAATADPAAVAAVLLNTLATLGVPGLPTPNAFAAASPTCLVLLLTHLFLYLPKFTASTAVQFSGRALTTLTETVSIDNTSAESRHYRVLLPPNSPFHAAVDEFIVGPRSSTALTFTVVPRTQRRLDGPCLLVDTSTQVRPAERVPFVFLLTAAPTVEPLRTIQVKTSLYESLQSELQVENPFPVNCVVSLRVSQTRLPPAATAADEAKASSMPWLSDEQNSHWRAAHDAPFIVTSDVLSLRRGETTRLPYAFIPLSRGTYRLLVTFHEESEGEFTYAVEATCGWPKPVEAGLELRVEQGEQCSSTLTVKGTNAALERCLKLYEDRAHRTQRTDLSHLLSGAAYSVFFVNDQMEGPNPFFAAETATYAAPLNAAANGVLPFTFRPQSVGVYKTFVLLLSPVDVRLMRVSGECVPKGDRRELQFLCPARQSIAQQITLCNHTAEDWLFTATLDGSPHFSGPHDVRVPSGRSKDYTVKYSPTWITTEGETAALLLLNSTTGQKHTYTLQGNAEAPLSEGIVAVDCRSREHDVVELMVPNIVSQDATYFVKVDVPYCEGESPSLVIPRASTRRYTVRVNPTVGGDYTGRVTFTAPNGRYVWYAVQLHVDPPEKEGTVDLVTDVRTSMVAEVTVANPLDVPLVFKVQRYGAGLYGANSFQLAPKAAATYGVLFVPTQAGESTGRLSLVSDTVGEFWYELRMKVTEAEPERLPFATTPLGQRQLMQVHLPNRTNASCALTVESTNPAAFNVTPARVALPPNSETVVDLVFTPNTVGVEQQAIVTLRNPELGCWRYACTGTGAPPLPADPIRCTSTVGATTIVTLPFTNLLSKETGLEVRLKNASPAFSLRAVPTGPVAAGAAAPITVAFTPTLVQRYDAVVEVRPLVAKTDKACNVVWSYPIEGYCEYRQMKPPLLLRCAARTQVEQAAYLHAPGLTPELASGVSLTFEVDANQTYRDTAASSVTCALTTPSPYPDGFEVQVKFTPLRPFIGSGWVVIHGAEGGTWRYRVQFEATAAAPDDTIVLYGEYKETTSASFDLYNVFPYRSPFFAYFTGDSSRDLVVTPSHGVLLPFVPGQRGAVTATNIQITVRPTSRIPQVEGTLVVDTDDMQWIFRVVAKFGHQARGTT